VLYAIDARQAILSRSRLIAVAAPRFATTIGHQNGCRLPAMSAAANFASASGKLCPKHAEVYHGPSQAATLSMAKTLTVN
jgi:hypothetical protein